MNNVVLMGRLTRNPEMRKSATKENLSIVNYCLAVERPFSKKEDGTKEADFINIVAFGKTGEFAMKYFTKGQRISVQGRIQVNQYTNKEGKKVNACAIIAQNQEFADAPFPKDLSNKEADEQALEGFTNAPDVDVAEDVIFEE